jgi:hypothetical protein
MAAITDYDTLKSALTSYIDRGTDLDGFRDDWIDFAEAYFNRNLRTVDMEEEVSLTTDSSGNATLPTDFLGVVSARRIGSPNIELRALSVSGENRLSPFDTAGQARFYSVSGTTFRVTPIEQGTGLVTLTYYEKIVPLDGTNTTNWLLTLAPDLYFYRALAEGFVFMRDFEKAAAYKSHADEMMTELKMSDEQARYANAGVVYDGQVD